MRQKRSRHKIRKYNFSKYFPILMKFVFPCFSILLNTTLLSSQLWSRYLTIRVLSTMRTKGVLPVNPKISQLRNIVLFRWNLFSQGFPTHRTQNCYLLSCDGNKGNFVKPQSSKLSVAVLLTLWSPWICTKPDGTNTRTSCNSLYPVGTKMTHQRRYFSVKLRLKQFLMDLKTICSSFSRKF